MSNDEKNDETRSKECSPAQWLRRLSDFDVRICFVIRHSDFVIPVASEPTASSTSTSRTKPSDYPCDSVSIRG
jgi:hypothetical protein